MSLSIKRRKQHASVAIVSKHPCHNVSCKCIHLLQLVAKKLFIFSWKAFSLHPEAYELFIVYKIISTLQAVVGIPLHCELLWIGLSAKRLQRNVKCWCKYFFWHRIVAVGDFHFQIKRSSDKPQATPGFTASALPSAAYFLESASRPAALLFGPVGLTPHHLQLRFAHLSLRGGTGAAWFKLGLWCGDIGRGDTWVYYTGGLQRSG